MTTRALKNEQIPARRATLVAALVLLTAPVVAGCSEKDPPSPPVVTEGDAFLVGTRVWDDTTTTSYFHVVSSLDKGTAVDPAQALEVPGSAKLYSVEGAGWFAVGGGEEPTITRYGLSKDGKLEQLQKISLQGYGVQDLWPSLYVVSPTKMYYPDRAGKQLIIINPKEMVVEGTVALPGTERDGYLSVYSYTPLLRDGKLLFSVGWFDWEKNDAVLGETGLVVLDTATDKLVRVDVDKRCGGITQPVIMSSGDTYFVSSALAGAAHRLGRLSTQPCALRVQSGADAFDASYAVHLDEITSSKVAGEPVPSDGKSLFLRVFDESMGTVKADDATWNLTSQPVWNWWRWDMATGKAAAVSGLAPSTSDVVWVQVGDRVFGTETTKDYAETTLIEVTAEGGPKRALTAPGFLHGVAKIR